MDITLAIASGAFIGAVLGFVGAGGAMLSVPILIYIFHFSPSHATTAALAIVFISALSGSIPKIRSKDILYRDALSVWGIGLVTNVGASALSKHLSPDVIVTGFAGVLIVAALSMLQSPFKPNPERRIPIGGLIVISLIIGAITGLFGIGGGFLAIPILVLFYNTPQNKAAGTSLLIIALNCFTAFIAHHSVWHEIRWSIPTAITIASVTVALLASHFSVKVPATILRRAFAILLILIAVYSMARTWLVH